VNQPLQSIDWRGFLARHSLPSPSAEVLSALAREPILITGAGGSIGSALALKLAALASPCLVSPCLASPCLASPCLVQPSLAPPALIAVESSENHLYTMLCLCAELEKVQKASSGGARIVTPVLGSAGDRESMEEIFAAHSPRIVFHAAAYKHVPLLEEQPLAAIANNIFATETIAAVATAHGARVVLLSTDKAVEPASVMGATKRVAEDIVLARGGTVLRLGNVLASSGSVTEVFAGQIARGGPLTITDRAARRYFLTLDEAVKLLLRAAAHSSSALLVPALPRTHGIAELADFMAGQIAPGREIPILFTGLRAGDKITERLWDNSDITHPIGGDMVSVQSKRPTQVQLQTGLAALHAAVRERDLLAALAQLDEIVPGFHPSEAVLGLARHSNPRVCA
jgi:FlaA1/EpsC-like NDP-sugar epimerase